MKSIQNYFTLGLLLLLSSGCLIDFDDDGLQTCIRGEGGIISEELDIAPFTGIDLQIDADVFLTQGDEFSVVAEGQFNIIRELDYRVRNGIWDIDLDRCVRRMDDLRIYITLPEITYLEISSSGNIYGENNFDVEDVLLEIDGSGDMDLALDADDIDAVIEGSGNIQLEGTANDIFLRLEGSGLFRAFGLACRCANIRVDGSGDAEVTVAEELRVRILGSGDVLYKGNPVVDADINGSGRVIDAN
jgi:hypothetical protein